MHTPALFTLLAATALAFPTPQTYLSGIPGLFMAPNRYTVPGCLGGQICNSWEWYKQMVNGKPLTADSAETQTNEQSLTARQEPGEDKAGVFYCKDAGWGGDCIYHKTPLGSAPNDCTQLDLEASSVGPDEGYYCIFYTNGLCAPLATDGSDALSLAYPGTDNLAATPKGDFNDRLLSYQCFRDEDYKLDPLESGSADVFEMAKAKAVAEGAGV